MATVNKIIRLHPDHISAYSLIVEKGTPFYEKYKFDMVRQEAGMRTEFLPNEDELYDMEKAGQKAFMDAATGSMRHLTMLKEVWSAAII